MSLYILATPIGNLEDFSSRGIRILKEADLILCEDTRTTKKLLFHFEISKPTISYHQHSKLNKLEYILEQLKQDKNLVLVSEAGTPTISDPGAKLISYLLEKLPDLKIIPVPGPCALITALSISGFPADKFVFFGFPPIKKKRKKFFEKVIKTKGTLVFYESCHRIIKTLEELKEMDRNMVVCRELTKKFETIYRGKTEDIIEKVKNDEIRGEFVIVIE